MWAPTPTPAVPPCQKSYKLVAFETAVWSTTALRWLRVPSSMRETGRYVQDFKIIYQPPSTCKYTPTILCPRPIEPDTLQHSNTINLHTAIYGPRHRRKRRYCYPIRHRVFLEV